MSNVDFTNSRPQVLLEVVLHTVAANAGNRKSDAAKIRYLRWVALNAGNDILSRGNTGSRTRERSELVENS